MGLLLPPHWKQILGKSMISFVGGERCHPKILGAAGAAAHPGCAEGQPAPFPTGLRCQGINYGTLMGNVNRKAPGGDKGSRDGRPGADKLPLPRGMDFRAKLTSQPAAGGRSKVLIRVGDNAWDTVPSCSPFWEQSHSWGLKFSGGDPELVCWGDGALRCCARVGMDRN